jgi:phospholipid/cholesterol/gamma-HCH transport system ATP-binding protein
VSATVLSCRDVACGYHRPVLEGVTFDVRAGEIVGLLGGSGCGKSTLLRTLTGLLPPLAGEVRLFGESLYDLPPEARNQLLRRTGTAFQQDALFGSMTVADNIAVPLRELTDVSEPIIREMVRTKLALVGLAGLERRDPVSMSGGQRKRAALARATILDPEVLFCDEPSAGLDPVVAASTDATLLQLRAALGAALVIVTHELESIRAIVDRAVMFARGTICAAGTIDELLACGDRDVYNFFHRIADDGVTARPS